MNGECFDCAPGVEADHVCARAFLESCEGKTRQQAQGEIALVAEPVHRTLNDVALPPSP
jgi:hypothetical protein